MTAVKEQCLPLPHHAEHPVVHDDDRNICLLTDGSCQLGQVHAEAAVAGDEHRALSGRDLRADRGTEPEAHGTESAACQERARIPKRIPLRRPHLVLPDVGHDDRVLRHRRADRIQDLIMRQAGACEPLGQCVVGFLRSADFLRAQRRDPLDPCRMPPLPDMLYQSADRVPQFAADGQLRVNVFIELRAVNVDMHDTEMLGEAFLSAGRAVAEACAQRDHEVGFVLRRGCRIMPVHPLHPEKAGDRTAPRKAP